MKIERNTYVNFIVTVEGSDDLIYSNNTEKQLKNYLKHSDFYIREGEKGEKTIEIDGDIYTVEDLDNLSDDKEIEKSFISSLEGFLSSLGIKTVSIKGESVSQSEETLRATEEEKGWWRRREMQTDA